MKRGGYINGYFWIGGVVLLLGLVLYKLVQMFSNSFSHTCVISGVDGNTYCVRDRKRVAEAADKLARVAGQCGKLIEYMDTHGLSPELTGRLKRKFKPDIFMETLPNSQYEAYSENKGDSLALCLNKSKGVKSEDPHLIDEHTLMYVAIHELGHICTLSVGHEPEFWDNFRTLLGYAKDAGIHHPVDYSKQEQSYCGLTLTDNHYFS
jgi:hypothetical protein